MAAVFIRFYHLESNPLWYTDETNYITLSWQLGHFVPVNQAAHKALIFPFATDAVPHPPLFFAVDGLMMRLLGKGVLAGRFLSALLGLLCTYLLYNGVRRLFGKAAGFVAAGLFAFHLPSVFFLRWGMPYNLSMACTIGAFWALAHAQWGTKKELWLARASFLAGLAALSAFFGLPVLVFVSAIAILRLRRKPLALSAVLAIGWLPILAFLLVGTFTRGNPFWNDFLALGLRASGGGSAMQRLHDFGFQLLRLITGSRLRFIYGEGLQVLPLDFIYPLGVLGIFCILWRARHRRWIPLFFLFTALPALLKRAGDPEIKYDEVMFLFFIYIGFGVLLSFVLHYLKRKHYFLASRVTLTFASFFLLALACLRIFQVITKLPSQYERFGSVHSIEDARAVAQFVNSHVSPNDLILAPERIDFLLNGKVTSVYQSLAKVTGSTTWHHNIEPWRYAFDTDFHKARFIILDETDRALVLQPSNPNMETLLNELQPGRWRLADQIGEYVILEQRA